MRGSVLPARRLNVGNTALELLVGAPVLGAPPPRGAPAVGSRAHVGAAVRNIPRCGRALLHEVEDAFESSPHCSSAEHPEAQTARKADAPVAASLATAIAAAALATALTAVNTRLPSPTDRRGSALYTKHLDWVLPIRPTGVRGIYSRAE